MKKCWTRPLWAAGIVMLVAVPTAQGCPFCDSAVAEETRSAVFNESFVPTLLGGLLPFVLTAAVALSLHLNWRAILTQSSLRKDRT